MSVTLLRAWPTAVCPLAACLLQLACELPEAPIVQERWIVPVEETVVDVNELLPAGVVDASGTAFDMTIPPVGASETLGDLCGAPCVASSGLTAPVPAFSATLESSENFPADVLSATLQAVEVDIEITNGFSFDPLENGGTLDIVMTDGVGGAVLGRIFLDGATDSLPPGAVETRTVTLVDGVTVTGPLAATATIDVAGGQVATIDETDSFGVAVTVDPLLVGSITVLVAGRTVNIESAGLEIGDLDDVLTDPILSGTILLDVANPFGAGVDGTIEIGGVTKPFSIPAGPTSTVALTYTGDELRSFLGTAGAQLVGSGVVVGGPVTIAPGLEMRIDATLDIALELGS